MPLIVLWIIPVALAGVIVSYIFWGPIAATISRGTMVLASGIVRVWIHRSVVDSPVGSGRAARLLAAAAPAMRRARLSAVVDVDPQDVQPRYACTGRRRPFSSLRIVGSPASAGMIGSQRLITR